MPREDVRSILWYKTMKDNTKHFIAKGTLYFLFAEIHSHN